MRGDDDSDGLTDEYERLVGLEPSAIDADQDALSDAFELLRGTDPTGADTDQDARTDGLELEFDRRAPTASDSGDSDRGDAADSQRHQSFLSDPEDPGELHEFQRRVGSAEVYEGTRSTRRRSRTVRLEVGGDALELGTQPPPRVSLAAAVKEALGVDVKLGALGLNVPPMRQGREDTVEVSISRADDADTLMRTFVADSQFREVQPIQTSAVMHVALTGQAFQIRRRNPPDGEQLVSDTATWEFEVTPRASGTQYLTVSATMQIAVPGHGEKTLRVPSLKGAFQVEVDRIYAGRAFMRRNWQWVCSSCIAVTLAVLGILLR
jgi:hypothetical protein